MADDPTTTPESDATDPSAAAPASAPQAAPPPVAGAAASAGSNAIGQDELDQLKAQFEALKRGEAGLAGDAPASVSAPASSTEAAAAPAEPPPGDDALMAEMAAALAQDATAAEPPVPASAYQPEEFGEASSSPAVSTIELLDDVELEVRVELGRTEMYIEDVLKLGNGSVIELDKLAGDPVDIYVNKRLVARGEVLVLNDNFCVRINSIHSPIPELETA